MPSSASDGYDALRRLRFSLVRSNGAIYFLLAFSDAGIPLRHHAVPLLFSCFRADILMPPTRCHYFRHYFFAIDDITLYATIFADADAITLRHADELRRRAFDGDAATR